MRNASSRQPLLASVALTLAVAAGCSSSGHRASPPTTTGSVGEGAATVLAAYRAQWADFEAASRVFPVDPNNPRLPQHMAGIQLSRVRDQLSLMRSQSQYIQGPLVDLSRARVVDLQSTGSGQSATVGDCELDPSHLVSGPSGLAISRPSGVRNLVHATLQLLQSQWKVTALKVLSTGCKNP